MKIRRYSTAVHCRTTPTLSHFPGKPFRRDGRTGITPTAFILSAGNGNSDMKAVFSSLTPPSGIPPANAGILLPFRYPPAGRIWDTTAISIPTGAFLFHMILLMCRWITPAALTAGIFVWTSAPVSYTHLDVYKRQIPGLRGSALLFCSLFQILSYPGDIGTVRLSNCPI